MRYWSMLITQYRQEIRERIARIEYFLWRSIESCTCVLRKHTSHYRNCLFDIAQIELRSAKIYWKKKRKRLKLYVKVPPIFSQQLSAIIGEIRVVERNIDLLVKINEATRRLPCGDQFARLLRDEPNYGALRCIFSRLYYMLRRRDTCLILYYRFLPRLLVCRWLNIRAFTDFSHPGDSDLHNHYQYHLDRRNA